MLLPYVRGVAMRVLGVGKAQSRRIPPYGKRPRGARFRMDRGRENEGAGAGGACVRALSPPTLAEPRREARPVPASGSPLAFEAW